VKQKNVNEPIKDEVINRNKLGRMGMMGG